MEFVMVFNIQICLKGWEDKRYVKSQVFPTHILSLSLSLFSHMYPSKSFPSYQLGSVTTKTPMEGHFFL